MEREKITAGVETLLFPPTLIFNLTFSFREELNKLSLSLSTFNYSIFREELQEFWNPGQCSAQQYEELEGLEDFAYEDEDDEDEFYEDEDEGT